MILDHMYKWEDSAVASGTSLWANDIAANNGQSVAGSRDVGANQHDWAIGRPLYFVVEIDTDFAGTATGVEIKLILSDTEALSGNEEVVATTGDLGAATAVDAGMRFVVPFKVEQNTANYRYAQVKHAVTGGATTGGAYKAYVVTDYDANINNYPT